MSVTMKIKAIAPWFGGKRTLAPKIIEQLGKHTSYWEPFCGGMSVLFSKEPSREETVNDLHGDLVNLARVAASDEWWELADRVQRTPFCEDLFAEAKERLAQGDGDEMQRAADFLAVSWMGMNGVAGTKSHNHNFALRYTSNGGDPAKQKKKAKHERLAALLRRFTKTRVVVSYYASPALDTLTRTMPCGHTESLALHPDDQHREKRRAKFLAKERCRDCGRKAAAEHNAKQQAERPKPAPTTKDGRLKKGQELKHLPAGVSIFIHRQPDGTWKGCIMSNDRTPIEGTMGGAMGLVNKLARKWLQKDGVAVQGQVKE